MIKPLIILFNTISVFFFSFFFGDNPVTITGRFPKTAQPGTEFTAEIKVNKGTVGGFAKLQLEVPQGFTVKELESKGGSFSFASNIAKIIWTATPSDPEFTVKFNIVADASATGLKTIASKFSYVQNNNKEVVEMTPAEIQVGDNASAPVASGTSENQAPATSQPVNTQPATIAPSFDNQNEPSASISCIRSITQGTTPTEVAIEVKIKKPGIKGFAKYQEQLPAGYTAKAGKTNGSSFSVSDGKAKFVWVSLPAEDEMLITYTLERAENAAPDARLENGEFSYLENDQTKKIKLPVEALGSKPAENPVAVQPVTTQTETTEPVTTETVAVATSQPVTTEPQNTPATDKQPAVAAAKKEGNVAYMVQIGAFRNSIGSDVLSRKFNISETVKSEMAEGFHKFMVGNFGEYKQARDHRENVKQKGCNSAFVVAYNGAKRITVQEALMITSQKWFK